MKILTRDEELRVVEAIKQGERATSAEIKIHIDKRCPNDPLERAIEWFHKLKMNQTQLRNGVLIYVASDDRKMAIIGDKGINSLVEADYWDTTYQIMRSSFSKGDYCQGLCEAIDSIATILGHHFPYQSDDINELSDDISYGK